MIAHSEPSDLYDWLTNNSVPLDLRLKLAQALAKEQFCDSNETMLIGVFDSLCSIITHTKATRDQVEETAHVWPLFTIVLKAQPKYAKMFSTSLPFAEAVLHGLSLVKELGQINSFTANILDCAFVNELILQLNLTVRQLEVAIDCSVHIWLLVANSSMEDKLRQIIISLVQIYVRNKLVWPAWEGVLQNAISTTLLACSASEKKVQSLSAAVGTLLLAAVRQPQCRSHFHNILVRLQSDDTILQTKADLANRLNFPFDFIVDQCASRSCPKALTQFYPVLFNVVVKAFYDHVEGDCFIRFAMVGYWLADNVEDKLKMVTHLLTTIQAANLHQCPKGKAATRKWFSAILDDLKANFCPKFAGSIVSLMINAQPSFLMDNVMDVLKTLRNNRLAGKLLQSSALKDLVALHVRSRRFHSFLVVYVQLIANSKYKLLGEEAELIYSHAHVLNERQVDQIFLAIFASADVMFKKEKACLHVTWLMYLIITGNKLIKADRLLELGSQGLLNIFNKIVDKVSESNRQWWISAVKLMEAFWLMCLSNTIMGVGVAPALRRQVKACLMRLNTAMAVEKSNGYHVVMTTLVYLTLPKFFDKISTNRVDTMVNNLPTVVNNTVWQTSFWKCTEPVITLSDYLTLLAHFFTLPLRRYDEMDFLLSQAEFTNNVLSAIFINGDQACRQYFMNHLHPTNIDNVIFSTMHFFLVHHSLEMNRHAIIVWKDRKPPDLSPSFVRNFIASMSVTDARKNLLVNIRRCLQLFIHISAEFGCPDEKRNLVCMACLSSIRAVYRLRFEMETIDLNESWISLLSDACALLKHCILAPNCGRVSPSVRLCLLNSACKNILLFFISCRRIQHVLRAELHKFSVQLNQAFFQHLAESAMSGGACEEDLSYVKMLADLSTAEVATLFPHLCVASTVYVRYLMKGLTVAATLSTHFRSCLSALTNVCDVPPLLHDRYLYSDEGVVRGFGALNDLFRRDSTQGMPNLWQPLNLKRLKSLTSVGVNSYAFRSTELTLSNFVATFRLVGDCEFLEDKANVAHRMLLAGPRCLSARETIECSKAFSQALDKLWAMIGHQKLEHALFDSQCTVWNVYAMHAASAIPRLKEKKWFAKACCERLEVLHVALAWKEIPDEDKLIIATFSCDMFGDWLVRKGASSAISGRLLDAAFTLFASLDWKALCTLDSVVELFHRLCSLMLMTTGTLGQLVLAKMPSYLLIVRGMLDCLLICCAQTDHALSTRCKSMAHHYRKMVNKLAMHREQLGRICIYVICDLVYDIARQPLCRQSCDIILGAFRSLHNQLDQPALETLVRNLPNDGLIELYRDLFAKTKGVGGGQLLHSVVTKST